MPKDVINAFDSLLLFQFLFNRDEKITLKVLINKKVFTKIVERKTHLKEKE